MVVRSVLVPTDFSAPASAALNFAVLIARRLGAALHVIHVVDTSPSARFWSKRVLSPVPSDLELRLVEAAWERFTLRLDAIDPANLKIKASVQSGNAAEIIIEAAGTQPGTLMVTGTRGQTGLPHVVLGSLAERLVRTAPCPVVTVHVARPAIRRIVAAADFGEAGDEALSCAGSLARAFRAALHVIHVVEEPWPLSAHMDVRAVSDIRELMTQDANQRLRERLAELGGDTTSEVVFGGAARGIADVAARKDADLIAIGTHGRGALAHVVMGSVADRVMRTAACPVLTVRTGLTPQFTCVDVSNADMTSKPPR